MRTLLTFLLAITLVASPALAADWGRYENARFGFVIAVPPEFSGNGEADNGDGQVFRSKDGTQTLRVYGGNILEDDFEADANAAMKRAAGDGWGLSYERVTPSWASWSGQRQGMIVYARQISLCEGSQYARFELTYPQKALDATNAVVDRLVSSLRQTEASASC